jgi:hypothetical protein
VDGFICLRTGTVVAFCEHGNEPSCSIKSGKIINRLSALLASRKGFHFMQFVGQTVNAGFAVYLYI